MRIAYFDCFAGASGDMILGSLVDAGLAAASLSEALQPLGLDEYRLEVGREKRGPIAGTRVQVILNEEASRRRRSLHDIEALLDGAGISAAARTSAQAAFRRLAAAEAQVHGIPVEEVHFHEVGATDAIVDVVGAFLGLELLGVQHVFCSPLPGGQGTVASSHGMLPLPAPATLALLAGAGAPLRPPPVTGTETGELVTPTAAAILSSAVAFRQPAMTLSGIGYGVGARDHPELPNVLRVWLGESRDVAPEGQAPTGAVDLLETNIDDMNPELYGYVAELLFQQRALDVWFTPIQMKKARPGTLLSVLARPEDAAALAAVLLEQTSTLGVRMHRLERWEAQREQVTVPTPLGEAVVKIKWLQGKVDQLAPEYESCVALAREHGIPLKEVYRVVQDAAWAQAPSLSPQSTGR